MHNFVLAVNTVRLIKKTDDIHIIISYSDFSNCTQL